MFSKLRIRPPPAALLARINAAAFRMRGISLMKLRPPILFMTVSSSGYRSGCRMVYVSSFSIL